MKNQRPLSSYGSSSPSKLMEKFYKAGSSLLVTLRNGITSPENRKQPRLWGTIEASHMVGVSPPTFRRLLDAHENIPGIVSEKNANNREIKKYTLEAINRLRDLAKTRYIRPMGSSPLTIIITNLKGGVGKTQTSVDLCKKIAMEGMKVLLLDFDAQGTATLISTGLIPDLELSYQDTITDTLVSDPTLIHKIIRKTHFDGFDIIPANLAIQDCDLLLPSEKENNSNTLGSEYKRLENALNLVKNQYDIIIVDCGPNIGLLTLNAIVACDGMVVPIPPNMSDFSSFIMYTATLNNLFRSLPNKRLEYFRILLSKHPGSKEAKDIESMMNEQFGRYKLSKHMVDTVMVSKAASEIGSIYDISKQSGSKEAYRRALDHLDAVNMEIINDFKDIWLRQSTEIVEHAND